MLNLRYTLLFFMAFLSAMPLSAQTISIKESTNACYTTSVQTFTLSSSSGSPSRNIYTGTNFNGNNPMRVIWVAASSRWEIQQFYGGAWVWDYYSTFASHPNPPNLATGGWVQDPACNIGGNILNQFNGTGTQSTLPISLLSATTTVQAQNATLHWITATENNNDRFIIEQQTTKGWKQVGEVQSNGNSINPTDYRFTVPNLAYGQQEFRLLQIDKNGNSTEIAKLSALIELTESYALSEAYPNPFATSANFSLAVAESQSVIIKVYDVQGRHVATLHEGNLVGQSTHEFQLDGTNLSAARYVIRVEGQSFTANKMITLVK